jgi:hypothetical protein
MAKRQRKTAAERRQEFADAEDRVWTKFSAKLREVGSFVEAQKLARGPAPNQGQPGRRFYSNLAFFLGDFTVPHGSNEAERALYLALIRRLDEAGEIRAGARQEIENRFQLVDGLQRRQS